MHEQTIADAQAIRLAAQADLVLLTVEMLRSPQAIEKSEQGAWFDVDSETLSELLTSAFGDQRIQQAVPPNAAALAPTIAEALREVHQLARQLDRDDWSDEFWRLFDSSQACAFNQASYIRRDKGTILGDLCGFYNAFGWQGNLASGERPDHLLCQLEFVGMMLAMAARAENDQQRKIVCDALAQFARLHMHDWLPSACYQLIESSKLAYFGAVAQWLMVLWTQLTEFHTWPMDVVPESRLEPNIDPEDPYECGAPDLVQLNRS